MFVQIIQGHVTNPQEALGVMEAWDRDLRPEAAGFIGGTSGIATDGTLFTMARFESESLASANADRPEQTEWWLQMTEQFDAEPAFDETTDTNLMMDGGSDDAGFVQVMRGTTSDRKRLQEIDKEFEKLGTAGRKDILGGITCWIDDSNFVSVIYFTSEEGAREGEATEMPNEMKGLMEEYQSLVSDMEYIDLRDPLIF